MVGQVERADLDAHRHGRPVDDRAHQLVPVARQRRQLGDLVEERELVEPAVGRRDRSVVDRPSSADHRASRRGCDARPVSRERAGISSRRATRSSSFGAKSRRSSSAGQRQRGGARGPRRGRPAERVEAGQVVAGVRGRPRRPAAAIDDRLDLRRRGPATAAPSPTRSRDRRRGGSRSCSAPLPMIEPTVRSIGEGRRRRRPRPRRSGRPRWRRRPRRRGPTASRRARRG